MNTSVPKAVLASLLTYLGETGRSIEFIHAENGLTIRFRDHRSGQIKETQTLDTLLLAAMDQAAIDEYCQRVFKDVLKTQPFDGWNADESGQLPDLKGTPLEPQWATPGVIPDTQRAAVGE